jgi:FkbM family methyltransferase
MRNIINEIATIRSNSNLMLDQMVLQKLKSDNLPIFLWGSGNYANYIIRILNKNSIPIAGVFVDSMSVRMFFHGHQVSTFDEIQSQDLKINIVRGNGNIEREPFYQSKSNVNAVYSFFDIMGFGWSLDNHFLNDNMDTLNEMYNVFSDTKSKESFFAYVKSRSLSNWMHIQQFVCEHMYFPEFIDLNLNESFVDCGAFDGDTLKLFLNKVSNWDNYFAIEPSIEPYNKLCAFIDSNKLKNVEALKIGIWKKRSTLNFIEENDISHIVEGKLENGTNIEVDSIDNIFNDKKVSFIKMDLEGSELEALEGAKNSILKHKPTLAISIYHKQAHLFDIFTFINDLGLDYKFYFRIHTKVGSDAVLYAL